MGDSKDIVEKLLKNDASDIRFFEEYYKNSQDLEPMEESELESDSDSKLKKLILKRTVSVIAPTDADIINITIPQHLMTLPGKYLDGFITASEGENEMDIIGTFNNYLIEAIKSATQGRTVEDIPLKWTIDDAGIIKKKNSSKTNDYILRTCHLGTFLSAIADEIVTWSKTPKTPKTPVIPCGFIIVDLLNVFRQVVKRFFYDIYNESDDATIYSIVLDIILDNIDSRKENKIILCIQNHLFHNEAFIEFVKYLKASTKVNSILILPGHNRSSGDDVLGLMAYVLLKIIYDECSTELITYDGYMDFTSPYFKEKEFLHKFQKYIDKYIEMRKRRERDRIERYRETSRMKEDRLHGSAKRKFSGGTNKNKKSLLNKYTRKLKKLHKKRILSKKVVKKYNKNYKKKTLKRKNK